MRIVAESNPAFCPWPYIFCKNTKNCFSYSKNLWHYTPHICTPVKALPQRIALLASKGSHKWSQSTTSQNQHPPQPDILPNLTSSPTWQSPQSNNLPIPHPPQHSHIHTHMYVLCLNEYKKIARRTTGAKDFYLLQGIGAPWNSKELYSRIV